MANSALLRFFLVSRHVSQVGFKMARTTGIGGYSPFFSSFRISIAGLIACVAGGLKGGPFAEPGDPFLRHDLQLLRDSGLLNAPISTWPLSMGGLHAALHDAEAGEGQSAGARTALQRTRAWLEAQKQPGWSTSKWELAVRSDGPVLRSFLKTPREKQEAAVGASWLGNRFAGGLTVRGGFDRSRDWRNREDDALRFDGSYFAARAGNYSFSFDQLDRWWGPGWDGSLILSNNARPVPALTSQRRIPKPFESRWLGWLGPWNATTFMGRMEDERTRHPRPWLFGSRVDFAPTIAPGLEIGLSRTIQWGGRGRPNGLSTFVDAWLSQDNVGANTGKDPATEPGNQLAGVDLRYKLPEKTPVALYGQWIGEDEDKFMPNAIMNLYGIETWGEVEGGTWRAYLEYVDTGTWWWTDETRTRNITYNHHVYSDGYRHRGRSVGHSADSDSELVSLGLLYLSDSGRGCGLVARAGELNRGTNPDTRDTSSVSDLQATDLLSVDVFTRWDTGIGRVTLGVGWEDLDLYTGGESEEFTGFVRLTRSF